MIINDIKSRQILDSRQKPTIEVILNTEKGVYISSVPSGASTGRNEALELRDKDKIGVNKAIDNVNNIIAPELKGKNCLEQEKIDNLMINLDGTNNKSRLGANAILGVSLAICRAGASAKNLPLYKYIAELIENNESLKIPFPMFNILNGGAHSRNNLDIQEFMIIPQKDSFAKNLELHNIIINNLKKILIEQFGKEPNKGDEGGYDPMISRNKEALELLKQSINNNSDTSIGLDCAASSFYNSNEYIFEEKKFSSQELLDFYKEIVSEFNITSIEDPFHEEDWDAFSRITKQLPKITIVADDLTTTNIERIKKAEENKACTGIIIKLNQIGTLSETLKAIKIAKSFQWKTVISHRSGETMDDFIADLSVATNADYVKSGAYTKKERIIKYDRLLEIEKELLS